MKLFGHPDSGHAFKVRFFLAAAGIEHDYEEVDIFKPRHERSEEFRVNSRFSEVPLLLDDGRAYVQSNSILTYLAQRTGQWGAQDAKTFSTCREWLFWEANKIGMCLPQLRAANRFPEAALSSEAKQWLLARYTHDVGLLEKELADGRKFIQGGEPTVADFSLCGYLYFAEEAEVEVPAGVSAWLYRLSQLPGWRHPYDY